MHETPPHILAKRKAYHEINKQVMNDRSRLNYYRTKLKRKKQSRKRIISITLYDGRLYAKFDTPRAIKRYKVQNEYDSLWDKLISLDSLISDNAFRIVERINQIEYLTV